MSFHIAGTGKPEDVIRHVREEAARVAAQPYSKHAASVIVNAALVVEEAARKITDGVAYALSWHFDDDGGGSLQLTVSRANLIPAGPILADAGDGSSYYGGASG